MWHIYGKQYDLTEFIPNHPGGKEILINTKGQEDITALFETYHAFSDKGNILSILEKYKVGETQAESKYDFTLYNELLNTIKLNTPFKNRTAIKAKALYYCQNIIALTLYIICIYNATSVNFSLTASSLFATIAGMLWMSIGFNIMHDGSHYAISTNPKINNLLSYAWNSFGLWNHTLWFFHHVYYHHSFTNQDNDPDVYHYTPFAKKNNKNKKVFHFGKYTKYIILSVAYIFPGFYTGQAFVYFMEGYLKKKLLTIKVPKDIQYYSAYEICLSLLKIYILTRLRLPVLLSYIVSINIFYHMNIIGDHDTYETHVENKYTGNDFLKIQVCNSANFCTDSILWTHVFGGINYQIEHHLFPNMNHKHYPLISQFVRDFCKQKKIPYVEHRSIMDIYRSFLKTIDYHSL